jgi:hypothetical protein
MSTQIGFTPPPPPRKWRIAGYAGVIKELIKEAVTGDKVYFYDLCSDSGHSSNLIMQSSTRQSNEAVEAEALRLGLIR